MPQTFEAILRGDRLEWVGAAPPDGEVRVHVADAPATAGPPLRLVPAGDPRYPDALIAEESLHLTKEARGRLMGEAIAALRALNPDGYSEAYLSEWHENRKDRPLSGREND